MSKFYFKNKGAATSRSQLPFGARKVRTNSENHRATRVNSDLLGRLWKQQVKSAENDYESDGIESFGSTSEN